MERQVKYLFDEEQFVRLGVNISSRSISIAGLYVPALRMNRTYYRFKNGTLKAFRILAVSFTQHWTCGSGNEFKYTWFLIQEPNKDPIWYKDYINKNSIVFASRDDYYTYLQGGEGLNVNNEWVDVAKDFKSNSPSVAKEWRIVDGKPKLVLSKVLYLLVLENEIFVGLENRPGYSHSREECLKKHLQNMIIDDFDDEEDVTEEISIEIKVTPNQQKVRTIRFVEE